VRIGLVVPGFSADASDWCIPALRHLARALAATDDVRVIAVRYPYRAARYRVDDVEVLALGGATRRGPATLDVWQTTLSAIAAEHRRQPFDVLHAFWATESGLLTALAGRLLGIRSVVSLAGGELVDLSDIGYGDQRLAWERLKVRTGLRLASAVTGGSRYLLTMAQRHVARDKLRWAPLGVPTTMFSPAPRPEPLDAARIVHVGTLTPVKDQATLLRAFAAARARRPDLSLDIAGDGPLRLELSTLAAQLGVAEAVCFRGDVDHAALPEIYRAASVFALSSRHEAQAMVAIEAAACGLAVVGTNVGVVPELTARSLAVAEPGDAAALAQSLLASLDDLPRAADCARRKAQKDFGLEVCAARFRGIYLDGREGEQQQ
jgi:glycosyltransferase involved in cell wall biosynthesis